MNQKLILLVEDDENLRNSILLILQRAGHLVTATDCVFEALNILKSGKYHLVISDVDIPEIEDIFLPNIDGNYPNLSLIILTDQPRTEVEKENKPVTIHFLIKPVPPERLLGSIDEILGKDYLTVQY